MSGRGASCNRCFKCGALGHLRGKCPASANQGNTQRLFQGGGRWVTGDVLQPQPCNYCGKEQTGSIILQCNGCKCVKYHNKVCQKKYRKEHQVLCNAIQTFSKTADKNKKSNRFVSHLTLKQSEKFAKLVGKRFLINCCFNGKLIDALWDNGAQVSLI